MFAVHHLLLNAAFAAPTHRATPRATPRHATKYLATLRHTSEHPPPTPPVTFVASAPGGNCNDACAALGSTCNSLFFPQTANAIEGVYASMGLGICVASMRCDASECPLLGFDGAINGCYYCPDAGWYTTNNCASGSGTRVRLCPCDGADLGDATWDCSNATRRHTTPPHTHVSAVTEFDQPSPEPLSPP